MSSDRGESDSPESEPEHPDDVIDGPDDDDPLLNLSDAEKDRLLEQYIHYGEVAIQTTDQRVKTNRFFGTLLTSVLAGLFGFAQTDLTTIGAAAVLFAGGFGTAVCFFWYKSVQSYRRLNKARYAILNRIESVLPVSMYLDEWRYLNRERPEPELVEPRDQTDPDHTSHTIVELWFIRLLAAGYVTAGAYALGFSTAPVVADAGYMVPSQPISGLSLSVLSLLSVAIIYFILFR
jgi:hypothetical protein